MNADDVPLIGQIKLSRDDADWWIRLLGVSTLSGTCYAIMTEDMRSVRGIIRCCILAALGGYIAGNTCHGDGINEDFCNAIIGVSGFLANPIFLLLLKFAKMANDNPQKIIDFVLAWLPGRKKE